MNREIVKQKMKELLDVDTKSLNMRLPIALGKTQDGMICFRDLTSLHHLLIAGAAGQGKTSCLNGMIASLSKAVIGLKLYQSPLKACTNYVTAIPSH